MIKVAFVKPSNGEIESVRTVGSDSQYLDGQAYGGAVARHIPAESSETFIVTKYWSVDRFLDKPKKPSRFHFWSGDQWSLNQDQLIEMVRERRNADLSSADWTQMPDSPLSAEKKAEWAVYRQALRDLPDGLSGIESLDDVQWPLKPEA